jgi:long-chain fatty acid transport protein
MTFYTLNLNPAVAYQANSWLAVGAGFSVEYAYLNQSVALSVIPNVIDGQLTLKLDNTSAGFNLGALITPYDSTRIGIAYRSQIIHHLRGNIDFLNINAAPTATTKMVMPANIIASIRQALNPQFSLLGELGWSNWSSMLDSVVHVKGYQSVTQLHWHDTYRIGLAGQYQVIYPLLLQAGVAYDSSPTSSGRRLPDLPMDGQIRVGAGLEYALIRDVMLGVSYEYINFGKASINNVSSNGRMAGSYSRNFANVLQASLNVNCG